MLTPAAIEAAVELRRCLHSKPEIAGAEEQTAETIARWLARRHPDQLLRSVGGHGVMAVYGGARPGPTVVLRAELDGLPVSEISAHAHASRRPGYGHLCGHDGHMAMVAAVAELMAARRPQLGRVVLLFQPAEETGEGAARVVADPSYLALAPDWVFALHNLPGRPLGEVAVRAGCFACGSLGIAAELIGKSSHAAHPEEGLSPAAAMCRIIEHMGAVPQQLAPPGRIAMATVIHARLGAAAFGTSPGEATVMATLRADDVELLTTLEEAATRLIAEEAERDGLRSHVTSTDRFPVTVNDGSAVALVRRAAIACDGRLAELAAPVRWSEDFGHYGRSARTALMGLGAGEDHAPLHGPTYDFPDELLPYGIGLFAAIIALALGGA